MRTPSRDSLAVPSPRRIYDARASGSKCLTTLAKLPRARKNERVTRRGVGGTANANKLVVIGRRSGRRSRGARVEERVRCMPQIGSNIYAIGMITALRDYVRLLRAIPMLTLSSHHHHQPPGPAAPRTMPSSSLSRALAPLLSSPFSMTSRVNGKSGLLNDRSRDASIVRGAHATSASTFFLFFTPTALPLFPRFCASRLLL